MMRWPDERLNADRLRAVDAFARERLGEPLDTYLRHIEHARGVVDYLLEGTLDLTLLRAGHAAEEVRTRLAEIVADPDLRTAFRYLAGPPISADNPAVLCDAPSLSRAAVASDPGILDRLAQTVLSAHDRHRFPWLGAGREPTEAERQAASLATAALIAYQAMQTERRGQSGRDQEALVAEALERVGFEQVGTRSIGHLADAPGPGTFCRESKLRDQKADLVVGLWDRRTLAVECKVSNSSVNSYKRLNREAGGKAAAWLRELGTTQVVPAAVLSGVYALPSLRQAQDTGLSLFWAHDLAALTGWIETTRP